MHVRSMEQECRAQDSAVSSSGLTVPSEGEVLGSVTHHTDSEGGPGIQLRTSARVSKKLKLDSLAHSSSDKKGKRPLDIPSLSLRLSPTYSD